MFSGIWNNRLHVGKIVVLACLLLPGIIPAQDDYAETGLVYDNMVYRNKIKTIQFHPLNAEMQAPIYELGKDEPLVLSFDDLDADFKQFNFTFIHCDFNWQPSTLMPMDYINGFPEDAFTERASSLNTIQLYTHYKVILPTPNMKITKSGNYLLKVYEDNDPSKLVLTRRFYVVEKRVFISANCHAATAIEDRNYKQEIDFEINFADYPVQNPIGDIMVSVRQNQRTDNAINDLKPMYVKNNSVTYDYDGGNVFNGGSEYREFDIKNLMVPSLRVNYFEREENRFVHAYLQNDESKAFKRYSFSRDIDGQFVVRCMIGDPAIESDYVMVHFSLPCEKPLSTGDVYLFGAFSGFACLPEYKLQYDEKAHAYRCAALFKQGFYNYQYVVKTPGKSAYDETSFEGNRFETQNTYHIMVYNKGIGFFYDRLIGVQQFFSNSSSR